MVITPHHDYYPLTPEGQNQVPRFLRSWITPCEPPDSHVVCVMCGICCVLLDFTTLEKMRIYSDVSYCTLLRIVHVIIYIRF